MAFKDRFSTVLMLCFFGALIAGCTNKSGTDLFAKTHKELKGELELPNIWTGYSYTFHYPLTYAVYKENTFSFYKHKQSGGLVRMGEADLSGGSEVILYVEGLVSMGKLGDFFDRLIRKGVYSVYFAYDSDSIGDSSEGGYLAIELRSVETSGIYYDVVVLGNGSVKDRLSNVTWSVPSEAFYSFVDSLLVNEKSKVFLSAKSDVSVNDFLGFYQELLGYRIGNIYLLREGAL